MRSKPVWIQQGNDLVFQGRWTHDDVSSAWNVLSQLRIEAVDVSSLEQFDSALLVLLLQLSRHTQNSLMIRGGHPAMLSLVSLYNLNSLLTFEA